MSKRRIIFRADGNSQIGLGHVVRSLALADMLKDDFTCIFAIQNPSEAIIEQIETICDDIITLPFTNNYLDEVKYIVYSIISVDDIIVLDGYFFNADYQQIIKKNGNKLVCIDDTHHCHFVADVIINQAGGISSSTYSKEIYTRLCLGPAFALLRKPFLEAATNFRTIELFDKILISMGGADPDNHTSYILGIVSQANFKQIHVLIGTANTHISSLKTYQNQYQNVFLHINLTADEVCNLMKECPVAICQPSVTSYEYCSVGGILLLYKTASNQQGVFDFLLSNHLAFEFNNENLSLIKSFNLAIAQNLISNQRLYFSGSSSSRIKSIFQWLEITRQLTIRRTSVSDLMTFFEWANDPEVRRYAYSPNPISLNEHKEWFTKKLSSTNSYLYTVCLYENPVAQIRFEVDIHNKEAIISYLIAKQFRGKGFGDFILSTGIITFKKDYLEKVKFTGYVIKENIASCKVFEKLGFEKNVASNITYQNSYKYTLSL